MKGKKFLAGLLAGLSVVLGSWGLVACGGTDSSSSSSEATQPKGVLYEVVDGTAQVVGYEGSESSVTIEEMYEGVLVTKIGDNAFKNSTITSVEIPDTVTVIGNSAFYGCAGLTEIVIPEEVTTIGNSAFQDCNGLTEIVIPDNVTSIGKSAFEMCLGLMSATIGDSVTSIGDNLFDYSSSLSSITFKGTKAQWNKITKNTDTWNSTFVPATKVVCADGEVDL